MGLRQHLKPRAIAQIVLTLLTLASGIAAFAFVVVFAGYTTELDANFKGELDFENEVANLPCIRHTLPACDPTTEQKCWDRCCPAGYTCARDPLVGLFCEDGTTSCGKPDWCRDVADISGHCRTDVCQSFQLIKRMATWTLVIAGIAVVLDLVDVVMFAVAPDAVVPKTALNVLAAAIKWLAFGLIIGAGTQDFITNLFAAQCYNPTGMEMNAAAAEMLVSYVVTQAGSALLSMLCAPLSAYYGGKLVGVPYVKSENK